MEKVIGKKNFQVSAAHVSFQAETPLKTVSSAVHNAGSGLYRTFVNRHVDADYFCDDAKTEMAAYIKSYGFDPDETVGMMTAVPTESVEIEEYEASFGTVVIAVTAGVGNAVDASKTYTRESEQQVGTINTWVLINGELAEESFLQAFITATEAKCKALYDENVKDPLTGTIATGTSTDSILVAASQRGTYLPYGGTVTELGKHIAYGVYDCTVRAIRAYKKAKGWTS